MSNLQVQATRKKENCMATVTIAQMARLFVSASNSNILDGQMTTLKQHCVTLTASMVHEILSCNGEILDN